MLFFFVLFFRFCLFRLTSSLLFLPPLTFPHLHIPTHIASPWWFVPLLLGVYTHSSCTLPFLCHPSFLITSCVVWFFSFVCIPQSPFCNVLLYFSLSSILHKPARPFFLWSLSSSQWADRPQLLPQSPPLPLVQPWGWWNKVVVSYGTCPSPSHLPLSFPLRSDCMWLHLPSCLLAWVFTRDLGGGRPFRDQGLLEAMRIRLGIRRISMHLFLSMHWSD